MAGAIGAIGRIRQIAGSARSIRGEFRAAGGGARGVLAGAGMVADKLMPEAARNALREIRDIRDAAMGGLNGTIDGLRGELAELRSGKGAPLEIESVECRLVSAMQCRLDLQKAAMECEMDIQICELECLAQADICDVADSVEGATSDAPWEKPAAPFLRQGVQTGFFHEALRKWGCYFFCLLRWAEEVGDFRCGDDGNIVRLFDDFVARGWLDRQCKVLQPVSILNHLVGHTMFRTVTHEDRHPADPVAVERVNHGKWPHFILHIGPEVWDSWANPGKYKPVNWRRIA